MNEQNFSNPENFSDEAKMSHFISFIRKESVAVPSPFPLILTFGETETGENIPSESIILPVPNIVLSDTEIGAFDWHTEAIQYPVVTHDGFFTLTTRRKISGMDPEKNELVPPDLFFLQNILKIQKNSTIVLPPHIFDRPQGYFKGGMGAFIRIGNLHISEPKKWTPSTKLVLEKDIHAEIFKNRMKKSIEAISFTASDKGLQVISEFDRQLQAEIQRVENITT